MNKYITGHTGLLCLLGSPVEHSISPEMHNEACRQLGLDYEYLAFDVGTDHLKTAVEGLRVMGVRGFNLTMPDKNLMARLQMRFSPRGLRAVNTVVNNTDSFWDTRRGIVIEERKGCRNELAGKQLVQLGQARRDIDSGSGSRMVCGKLTFSTPGTHLHRAKHITAD